MDPMHSILIAAILHAAAWRHAVFIGSLHCGKKRSEVHQGGRIQRGEHSSGPEDIKTSKSLSLSRFSARTL